MCQNRNLSEADQMAKRQSPDSEYPQTPEAIRAIMAIRGLKVCAVAREYGCSGSFISSILHRGRPFSNRTIRKIAAAVEAVARKQAKKSGRRRGGERRDSGARAEGGPKGV